jgi:hypothetical protein
VIVVLDTNVWISALQFAKRRGTPTRALEKAMSEDVIASCREIEAEILRVHTDADGDNVRVLWIGKEKKCRIPVSVPRNLCATISYHCGEECRGGEFRALEKNSGKWQLLTGRGRWNPLCLVYTRPPCLRILLDQDWVRIPTPRPYKRGG